MLILNRRPGERIIVGGCLVYTVGVTADGQPTLSTSVMPGNDLQIGEHERIDVRVLGRHPKYGGFSIAVKAPGHVSIYREEIWQKIQAEKARN